MVFVPGYDPKPSDHLRVEVAFDTPPDDPNPAWVDLTDRLDLSAGVSIARGRADEFSVIQPSTCSLTLDNVDGDLTAGNPGSAFFPNVLPHRKIRVSYRNPNVGGNFVSDSAAAMESGVGDWTSNDAFGSLTTAQSWVSSGTHPSHGTLGGLATWPTTAIGSSVFTFVSGLTIGRVYTASLYVWVPAGAPNVRAQVVLLANGSFTSVKNAITRISVTFTATQTSHAIGVNCASATAGQQCWWDSLQVDEGTAPITYTLDDPPIQYRFTGYVEEWPTAWPNGGGYSEAQITAVDRLARIGSKRKMRSVIEETILADHPFLYFPMGEPEESLRIGDISGTVGVTPGTIFQLGSGGTLAFGTATGPPTDGLPAPTFTPANVLNGKCLLVDNVPNHGVNGAFGFFDMSMRASFLTSTGVAQTIMRAMEGFGFYLDVGLDAAGHVVVTERDPFAAAIVLSMTSPLEYDDGATHDVVVTLDNAGGTTTAKLYVDGVEVDTDSRSAASLVLYSKLYIGGNRDGAMFTGSISHVAVLPGALSAARVLEHYTATSSGFEGEGSEDRISRYATWAGFLAADMTLDVGLSTSICFTEITGASALSAMQDVAATEGGRLFIDGFGDLVFHSRSRLYDNPAATAVIAADQLDPDTRFSLSTQGLVNDATGQRPNGPVIRAMDNDSIETYGVAEQSMTLLVTSDTEVTAALYWRVLGFKEPQVRLPQGTFDLYTDSDDFQAQLRALELGDRITITDLPAQAPSSTMDLVLEGYTETIGKSSWKLSANLSNYSSFQALILDDNVYGLLDGDNRLIY